MKTESSGKVAVITGAGRGLGLSMAERLLKDGWRVEGWDLKAESALTHANFRMRSVDVTKRESVDGAAEACVDSWGVPHALVNNAGITRDSMLHKMSEADFEATYKVNVLGSFHPTQALGTLMRDAAATAQKAGASVEPRRLVMISSIAGVYGNMGQANYAASKAAVIGLMKSVAKEWGRYGISAVAVAPGLMRTEMTKTIPTEILQGFIDRTPLKRMGEPEELAALVALLCRAESQFLTGELISFSGGLLL